MSKLAVVTGGTKGIGRAIVEKFASQQFEIVTCSRNQSELEAFQQHIESIHKVRAHVLRTDLSSRAEVKSFSDFVLGLGQSVDVLVNNAGFFSAGKVVDEKEGVLEKTIEANLYSAYHITRGLLPALRRAKGGHIFNICSITSIKPFPDGGSYAISKFALLGFSKVLREELKNDQLRVTAVLAGATRTPSWEGVNLPEERFMRPEDVADAIFGAYSLSSRSVVEEIIIRPQLGDI